MFDARHYRPWLPGAFFIYCHSEVPIGSGESCKYYEARVVWLPVTSGRPTLFDARERTSSTSSTGAAQEMLPAPSLCVHRCDGRMGAAPELRGMTTASGDLPFSERRQGQSRWNDPASLGWVAVDRPGAGANSSQVSRRPLGRTCVSELFKMRSTVDLPSPSRSATSSALSLDVYSSTVSRRCRSVTRDRKLLRGDGPCSGRLSLR